MTCSHPEIERLIIPLTMTANLTLPSNLTLVNATPFAWLKVLNESTQMVEWDNAFPPQVDPGSSPFHVLITAYL